MGNIFNPDFRDFLQALNNNNVEYLLVGGYAVVVHGYPRTTGDMDIWVNRTITNYNKLQKAFVEFRMPLFDMTQEQFLYNENIDVFRFGRTPVAIDIMTKMSHLNFDDCFKLAREYNDAGLVIKVVHYNHLIEAKRAAGRYKDLNDIDNLENKA